MSVNPVQSATAYGFSQIQRMQALRNAEQLEAKAAALAAQASSVRKEADDAERRAGELEIEAGIARDSADSARLSVASGEGVVQMGQAIEEQVERILQSLQADDSSSTALYDQKGQTESAGNYTAGSVLSLTL